MCRNRSRWLQSSCCHIDSSLKILLTKDVFSHLDFIFEDQSVTDYEDSAAFMLVANRQELDLELVLVHYRDLGAALEENGLWFAGYIHLTKSSWCQPAWMVSSVVRNPAYKGAGNALYAFAAKVLSMPLTSDRAAETSVSAQKLWHTIEASPEWQEVKLNNYIQAQKTKTYYHVTTFPAKTIRKAEHPADEASDCRMPSSYGEVVNPNKALELLGTASAWRYIGSLDPKPLLKRGKEILRKHAKETGNESLGNRIIAAGYSAFNSSRG